MFTDLEKTNQTEQLRFWIHELTHFTPQQVETVIQNLPLQEVEATL